MSINKFNNSVIYSVENTNTKDKYIGVSTNSNLEKKLKEIIKSSKTLKNKLGEELRKSKPEVWKI